MSSINEQPITPDSLPRRLTWFEQNPKKTILGIIVVIGVVSDLLIGSLTLPGNPNEPHHYYHHGLKSNFKGKVTWGDNKSLMYTDSLGFKDSSNRKVDLRTNKKRILIMGDSFTEGVGMPYEKTFTGLASAKVDSNTYEIINAGASSFSTKLYYLRTKYLLEVEKMSFNELYVYVDISDIVDDVTYESFQPQDKPTRESIMRQVDSWFATHSIIYRYSRAAIVRYFPTSHYYEERSLWTVDEAMYKKWGEPGIPLSLRNMEQLYQLTQQHGIKMHVAVYPWPAQIKNKDLDSKQVQIWKQFAKEKNINFINYFPDFISEDKPVEEITQKYFIPGDGHWNEAGHEVIADKLITNINRQ